MSLTALNLSRSRQSSACCRRRRRRASLVLEMLAEQRAIGEPGQASLKRHVRDLPLALLDIVDHAVEAGRPARPSSSRVSTTTCAYSPARHPPGGGVQGDDRPGDAPREQPAAQQRRDRRRQTPQASSSHSIGLYSRASAWVMLCSQQQHLRLVGAEARRSAMPGPATRDPRDVALDSARPAALLRVAPASTRGTMPRREIDRGQLGEPRHLARVQLGVANTTQPIVTGALIGAAAALKRHPPILQRRRVVLPASSASSNARRPRRDRAAEADDVAVGADEEGLIETPAAPCRLSSAEAIGRRIAGRHRRAEAEVGGKNPARVAELGIAHRRQAIEHLAAGVHSFLIIRSALALIPAGRRSRISSGRQREQGGVKQRQLRRQRPRTWRRPKRIGEAQRGGTISAARS